MSAISQNNHLITQVGDFPLKEACVVNYETALKHANSIHIYFFLYIKMGSFDEHFGKYILCQRYTSANISLDHRSGIKR
jgi:hypothetical protein